MVATSLFCLSLACCCRLSKKAKYEKRIAVTVFSFPPDKGNVGTAAYLNVFGSIHKVLKVSAQPLPPHASLHPCILPPALAPSLCAYLAAEPGGVLIHEFRQPPL